MSNETLITRQIMLALGKLRTLKIFRNNIGTAWQGQRVTIKGVPTHYTILKDARPVHFGLCEGSSDLIGWTEIIVTPEMIGKKICMFTALEVKTGSGRISEAQLNFLEVVKAAGGVAGIVTSDEEATKLVQDQSRIITAKQ
jgi:VRR-NUC domain